MVIGIDPKRGDIVRTLREVLGEAQQNKVAVGHFNISDLAGLKAVSQSARELSVPVIVGLSDWEIRWRRLPLRPPGAPPMPPETRVMVEGEHKHVAEVA